MTVADIHIYEDKFFVLIDQCIYIQINNREKATHPQQTENIKTMTTFEENDLCKISKLDWARILKIENNILENCLLLLSNFLLSFNLRCH